MVFEIKTTSPTTPASGDLGAMYDASTQLPATFQVPYSGTYTPTLTNGTNIAASTAYVCNFLRVGDVVTVSGRVDIDPTAAAPTASVLGISLPIASTLSGGLTNCAGTAISQTVAQYGAISGLDASDRAQLDFLATNTANQTWLFHFTYRII